jgi:hypothetical protein
MGRDGQRKTRRNALRSAAGLCALLFLWAASAGCGYSFANSRLADDYATIAVPAFKNESFEPDIHARISNLLIRELLVDGRFRIVNDPALADLVLSGAVTNFKARAISLRENDEIAQYKIVISARASLEDVRAGKIIWQSNSLQGTDFYQTLGGRTREEALEEASENLIEKIIFECLDGYW